jgi:predicted metal-dependent hydrolase
MTNKIKFGSAVIPYTIFKTNRRKTSQISVDKDNVIVRSPSSKTNVEVKQMIQQKARWVFEKQQEFKKQKSAIVKPTFSEDTTVPYFGNNCILKINLDQKKNSIKFTNSRFIVNLTSKRLLKKEVKKTYDEWLTIKATKYLEARTIKLGTKIGLKPSKITVKGLKGKWGSALRGSITLNSNLMKCSKDTIDYIIIHELCHLKIQDHSHRYWNLVRKYYPKYKEKVKELEVLSQIVL